MFYFSHVEDMSCKLNQLFLSLCLKGCLDEQDDYRDNTDGEIKEKELMKEGDGLTAAFGTLTDKKSFKHSDLPPRPAASLCGAEPPHTTS